MEPTSLISAASALNKADGKASGLLEVVFPEFMAERRARFQNIVRAHERDQRTLDRESDRQDLVLDEIAKANARVAAENQLQVVTLSQHKLNEAGWLPGAADEPLDPQWLNTFRSWAGDASTDDARQLLAEILAAQVRSPGRYSSAFLLKLRTLDMEVAKGFEQIAKLVFGEVGIIRIFGKLNDDPLLQAMGVRYDDFLSCQHEGLIDRDKEIKKEFREPLEIQVGPDRFRFTEQREGAATEVMEITRFGRKVWELMNPKINEEYFARCVPALAKSDIKLERILG